MRLNPMRRALAPGLLLLLAACTTTYAPRQQAASPAVDLPRLFACLDHGHVALVAARGGRAFPHRAANALSSFQESRDLGIMLLSVDVSRSRDGELILLANQPLDRITTGQGSVGTHDFAALRGLRLKDANGYILNEGPPSLDEALVWASRHRAVLIVNPTIPGLGDAIARAVHDNGVAQRAILAVGTLADADAARRIEPGIALLARGQSADARQLARQGAARRVLLAAASDIPTNAQLHGLKGRGSFPLLVTGGRFDDQWLATGDGAPFAEQAARGITLFESDRPVQAWMALIDGGRGGESCTGK